MKRTLSLAGACVVLALSAVFLLRSEAAGKVAKPADKPIDQFMRQKLTDSEKVLEGLVTEDFAQIQKAAAEMHTLSQAEQWQVFNTPTYDLYSREFEKGCDQLETAAKEKNIDRASLAWIRVTMTCLSCHKHVRNAKVAEIPADADFQTALNTAR